MSNYNVKIKKGTFYLSSKTDQGEGWTKQEFQNPQNPDETMVRYHKTLSVEGTLQSVTLSEDKFAGETAKILVKKDGDNYYLEVPIMDKGGSVVTTNQYFNSLVGPLEKLNKGDNITMFVNSKNEDKNGRLYRNIVVLDGNGSLIKSDFSFKDTPSWAKQEVKNAFGKVETKWDASETNDFYIKKFMDVVNNFDGGTATTSPKQEAKTPTATPQEAFEPTEEESEPKLPF